MPSDSSSSSSLEDRWSDSKVQEVADLWELSDKDVKHLKELHERIQDIDHWKNDPHHLIRFLKEFHGKVSRAEKSFRQVIQWRHDNGMESFLERYGTPDPLFYQWPFAVLNTTDKDGDPIVIERFGRTDYSSFLNELGTEDCLQYSAKFTREILEQRSFWKCYEDHVGRRVRQYTMIVDLEGGGLEFLKPTLIRYLQKMSQIAQLYYPGWTKRVILLRAPRVFKYGWSAMKPLLSKEVQEKLVFTNSSDYLDVIQEYIELHSLPPCVYQKGMAQGMPGHFEKVKLRGGPLDLSAAQEDRKASFTSATASNSFRDDEDQDLLNEISERTKVSAAVLIKGVLDEEQKTTNVVQVSSSP